MLLLFLYGGRSVSIYKEQTSNDAQKKHRAKNIEAVRRVNVDGYGAL